jgi:TonB family protein
MQFAHFGVLDAGTQSKGSMFASLLINAMVGLVIVVLSLAAAKQAVQRSKMLTQLIEPVVAKKPEPIKPKVLPPKPKLPEIAKVEPKIVIRPVKLPDPPKQPIVKMDQPKPIIAPPAPQRIIPPAAPIAVSLAHPQAASVVNNDPHPSAVRLGNSTSPLNNLHGPAVASVNLAAGMPGMNAANTGNGPPATKVVLGNGSPGGTTIKGNGVVAVTGIPHGVPGGTGTGKVAGGGQQVNLGQAEPPPMPKASAPVSVAQRTSPKVIYKPKPDYTEEAKQLHVEGVVTVHIRVLPTGSVEIVGVISGLGHGLDESAKRAVQATRFEPATDAAGHPITWDGIVNVAFQLAG